MSTPTLSPSLSQATASVKAALAARRSFVGIVIVAVVVVLFGAYMFVFPDNKLLVGLAAVLLSMALMLLKIPITISMNVAAILGLLALVGARPTWGALRDLVFNSFASWSLSVIPMFILMGIALGKSGLMSGVYDMSRKWFGRLPGGLAVSSTLASAGMAATSGSSIGIAYAIGRVAIPEMIRDGYRPTLAMGSVAMAGTLGQIIPPSILLVIYAGVAETPIGPQLLAGVVPGLILAAMFILITMLWPVFSKGAAPRGRTYPWRERLIALRHLVPVAVIVVVVLGGIYAGIFTATEAGAFGAAVVILMGVGMVAYRARKTRAAGGAAPGREVRSFLGQTFMETASSAAAVFFLLIGVFLLTQLMALSGLAKWTADIVVGLGLNQLGFLLLLIPVYLVLGFFLDTLAMMLLTIPVFIGPLQALDVNLIWFGVFLIVLAEIDLVAPPLGVLNFVILAIAQSSTKGMALAKKLTIVDVFKGVTPFLVACVVFLVLLIMFPEIALWLPSTSSAE